MKPRYIFLAALFMSAHSLVASTIVSFTGDDSNTTDTQFTNLSAGWTSGVYAHNYSDSNQVFGGDAIDGTPALSGGVYATNPNINVGPSGILHLASVSPDQYQIGWSRDGGTTNTSFRYLFMALAPNWLTLTSGARFDSASSLSISTLTTNQTNIDSLSFVVEDAGRYYISQRYFTSRVSTFTITDPNSASWMQFDPTATNFGGVSPTQINGTPQTFNDIQAVGFFLQGTAGFGGTQPGTIGLDDWIVNATAIPEPSAAWLIFGGLFCSGFGRLTRRFGEQYTNRQGTMIG